MTTWPVLVQDWQHECCGDPFGVGDAVTWALVFSVGRHEGWGWPEEMLIELMSTGRRSAQSDQGAMDIIRTSDGPEVALYPSGDRDAATLRGTLIEDHHGGAPQELQDTQGTVLRIRIVSQRFRLGGNAWTPIPGAVRFRETEQMPRAFAGADERTQQAWHDLGALVDLELRAPAA